MTPLRLSFYSLFLYSTTCSNTLLQKPGGEFVASPQPNLIQNPDISKWKAFSEWCVPGFENLFTQELIRVRWSENSHFIFYNDQYYSGLLRPEYRSSGPRIIMTIQNLIGNATEAFRHPERVGQSPNLHHPLYISTEAKNLRLSGPGQHDILDDLKPLGSFAANHESTQIWFGSHGTTAEWHFDVAANTYVQICGEKLWEFAEFEYLQENSIPLQPWLSPLSRRPFGVDLPRIASSRNITLRPGDILSVPPYILHRVTALSPSVSVNSFADEHPSASLARRLHEQTVEFASYLKQFSSNCTSRNSFALSLALKLAQKLQVGQHLLLFASRQEMFVTEFSAKFSEESEKALVEPLSCEKCDKISLSKNKLAWIDDILERRDSVGMSPAIWQAIAQDALELFVVNLDLSSPVQVSRTLRCLSHAPVQCV